MRASHLSQWYSDQKLVSLISWICSVMRLCSLVEYSCDPCRFIRSTTIEYAFPLNGQKQGGLADTFIETYNPEIPTEVADRLTLTPPMAVARLMFQKLLHGDARQHPEKLDALEKAGFKTDRFGDLIHSLAHRFGGYYMDVGASAKIGQGLVGLHRAPRTLHLRDSIR